MQPMHEAVLICGYMKKTPCMNEIVNVQYEYLRKMCVRLVICILCVIVHVCVAPSMAVGARSMAMAAY